MNDGATVGGHESTLGSVGGSVGISDGVSLGSCVGRSLGCLVGVWLGLAVVGRKVGRGVLLVGKTVETVGRGVGGEAVGESDDVTHGQRRKEPVVRLGELQVLPLPLPKKQASEASKNGAEESSAAEARVKELQDTPAESTTLSRAPELVIRGK